MRLKRKEAWGISCSGGDARIHVDWWEWRDETMKKALLGILVFGFAATVSFAMGTVDQKAFRSAMEVADPAYAASMNAGDLNAYMANWDENGVQMPPDAPATEGKAAITAGMKGLFSAVAFSNFQINMLEAVQFGPEWGYTRGTYSYDFALKTGGPTNTFKGKFSTVWKKQADGSWKIYRDSFSSVVPPK
jgi:ketosteroid isomerase-like protein